MMESPLNLAHQQGRKADILLKSGKYEEAITCHNRAAEYLLEAMQQTKYTPALESLKLQHAHHLKQTDKLYDRQRRAHMLQIKQNKLQLCHQSTQTNIQGPVVPAGSDTFPQTPPETSPHHINEMHSGMENPSPLEENAIYRTLTAQDSLIGLLLRRKQNLADNNTSFHSGVPVERVFNSKSREINPGNKSEKETEDLRFHNEDLRQHVQQLLNEVEEVKKENKLLKEKVEGTQPIFSDVGDCELHLIPDLPPLEMPQFDLDLLEQENKKKRDDSETDVFGMSPL